MKSLSILSSCFNNWKENIDLKKDLRIFYKNKNLRILKS